MLANTCQEEYEATEEARKVRAQGGAAGWGALASGRGRRPVVVKMAGAGGPAAPLGAPPLGAPLTSLPTPSPAPSRLTPQELKSLSGYEREDAERRAKQRLLGNIRLIAELFNKEQVGGGGAGGCGQPPLVLLRLPANSCLALGYAVRNRLGGMPPPLPPPLTRPPPARPLLCRSTTASCCSSWPTFWAPTTTTRPRTRSRCVRVFDGGGLYEERDRSPSSSWVEADPGSRLYGGSHRPSHTQMGPLLTRLVTPAAASGRKLHPRMHACRSNPCSIAPPLRPCASCCLPRAPSWRAAPRARRGWMWPSASWSACPTPAKWAGGAGQGQCGCCLGRVGRGAGASWCSHAVLSSCQSLAGHLHHSLPNPLLSHPSHTPQLYASRIRFVVKDVLELRAQHWVARREVFTVSEVTGGWMRRWRGEITHTNSQCDREGAAGWQLLAVQGRVPGSCHSCPASRQHCALPLCLHAHLSRRHCAPPRPPAHPPCTPPPAPSTGQEAGGHPQRGAGGAGHCGCAHRGPGHAARRAAAAAAGAQAARGGGAVPGWVQGRAQALEGCEGCGRECCLLSGGIHAASVGLFLLPSCRRQVLPLLAVQLRKRCPAGYAQP